MGLKWVALAFAFYIAYQFSFVIHSLQKEEKIGASGRLAQHDVGGSFAYSIYTKHIRDLLYNHRAVHMIPLEHKHSCLSHSLSIKGREMKSVRWSDTFHEPA